MIYYGDEIGMGDNIYLGDRDGVRTPMQWSADRNAGFSGAPQQRLYLPLIVDYEYHHATVHVEAQEGNSQSLLAYMKRLLALRKRYRAFGRGSFELLTPANHRIVAFLRLHDDEHLLVVANLSRFSQALELDLADFSGCTPVELFGRATFWPIADEPYKLTLGPHAFYWFALTSASPVGSQDAPQARSNNASIPTIEVDGDWLDLVLGQQRHLLEEAIPPFLGKQPWFRGKVESVLSVTFLDAVPLANDGDAVCLTPIVVSFSDRDAEIYLLALQMTAVDPDALSGKLKAPIARIRRRDGGHAILVDAIEEGTINDALKRLTRIDDAPFPGEVGEVVAVRNRSFWPTSNVADRPVVTSHIDSVIEDDDMVAGHLVVKFLRRINEGVNSEWELGVALNDAGFPNVPAMLGALEYRTPRRQPMTVAVVQAHIPNQGNAWEYISDVLGVFLAGAMTQGLAVSRVAEPRASDLLSAVDDDPAALGELLEPARAFVRLLGRRAAELHTTLAKLDGDPAIALEPYTRFAQRSRYQSMRGLAARAHWNLRQAMPGFNEDTRSLAEEIIGCNQRINDRFGKVLSRPLSGSRIRTHGDFHLKQVLRTGGDVTILDFEGEPDRHLEERRLKASPLDDVANMLHSFRMATMTTGARRVSEADSTEDRATQYALLLAWYRWSGREFLDAYQEVADEGSFLPVTREERAPLLDAFLLEKALLELASHLHRTPDQLGPALRYVLNLVGDDLSE